MFTKPHKFLVQREFRLIYVSFGMTPRLGRETNILLRCSTSVHISHPTSPIPTSLPSAVQISRPWILASRNSSSHPPSIWVSVSTKTGASLRCSPRPSPLPNPSPSPPTLSSPPATSSPFSSHSTSHRSSHRISPQMRTSSQRRMRRLPRRRYASSLAHRCICWVWTFTIGRG